MSDDNRHDDDDAHMPYKASDGGSFYGIDRPDGPVRVLIHMSELPTLDEGSAPFLLCANDANHGPAAGWGYATELECFAGLCRECLQTAIDASAMQYKADEASSMPPATPPSKKRH